MSAGGPPSITIDPLGNHHSRAAFCCGDDYIDRWCKKLAEKEHARYRSRTFVATATGSDAVIGLYTLSLRTLAPKRFINSGYNGKEIPAIYFGALGVCQSRKKEGIGTALMVDAFKRSVRVTDDVGAYCMWLNAVSEEIAQFYEARQFERFKPGSLDMFILMDTIRDAVSAENDATQAV